MIKLSITLLLSGAILVSQAYVQEEFATFRSKFSKKYDETEEVSRINKKSMERINIQSTSFSLLS